MGHSHHNRVANHLFVSIFFIVLVVIASPTFLNAALNQIQMRGNLHPKLMAPPINALYSLP
jgi:hypothetical protein